MFKIFIVVFSLALAFTTASVFAPEAVYAVENGVGANQLTGPLQTVWLIFKVFIYAVIFSIASLGVLAVMSSLRVGVTIFESISNAIADLTTKVASIWNKETKEGIVLSQDTPIDVGGKKRPLGSIFNSFVHKTFVTEDGSSVALLEVINDINTRLSFLEEKTADLPDPPKPMTIEEKLAELERRNKELEAAVSKKGTTNGQA